MESVPCGLMRVEVASGVSVCVSLVTFFSPVVLPQEQAPKMELLL